MKVSIITVTFNSGATLFQTIQSVLNQTYKDIDYWLIDGLSSDDTIDIIKSFEDKFAGRLHYILEKDKGIYDAMNKGVNQCTGDIIGILNSDDFFTSNDVIEKMVHHFTEDVDMVYGDVHFIKGNRLNRCTRYYSGKIFKPWMVRFGFIPPHPSVYIRSAIYTKYGAYDDSYQISADYELIARLCYKNRIKTKYIHMDFVTMRIGGASTRNWNRRLLGTKEDLIACRRLGIKTNIYMIFFKYVIKILESLFIRK
jgi:glycosyltransferase involved in cell wall biosynthesis